MKINGKDNTPGLSQLGNVGGQSRTKASSATEQTGAGTSAVATLSNRLRDVKGGDAPFDAEKVESIRQAIKDGKFEVNPDAIAKAIIASAKELTGQV